jgi:hypothetical protein
MGLSGDRKGSRSEEPNENKSFSERNPLFCSTKLEMGLITKTRIKRKESQKRGFDQEVCHDWKGTALRLSESG